MPWLTPLTSADPLWRLVHGGRLFHAQTQWVCQVCGTPCLTAAVLIVDEAGLCRTSAPLHSGHCTDLALAVCPALTGAPAQAVTVTRAEIISDGETDLDLGLSVHWRVRPEAVGLPDGPGKPTTAATMVAVAGGTDLAD